MKVLELIGKSHREVSGQDLVEYARWCRWPVAGVDLLDRLALQARSPTVSAR